MTNYWYKIKGWFARVIALIFCPCHLPLTFPFLLVLTAGTSLGAWLSRNYWLFFLSP